jgi:hypothetical protein
VITEEEVVRAVPPYGFIRQYVVHALQQTTAPLAYHLGTGLSILSSTCPMDYGMNYAGKLRANMFVLLVGRSGEDQKSSALGIGRDLLFEAASPLVGDFPGSPEGLIDSLTRAPSQMIPISEMGRFLASAQKGYYEPIKALMADLWDSHSIQRAKANGKTVRIDNPRLSVVAACSLPYLEKYTLAEDWTGGFMGRWSVMYGMRERVEPDPAGNMSNFQSLADDLRARAQMPTAGFCRSLTPRAKQMWSDWFHEVSARKLPDTIVGIRSRAPTMARKAALLYAWDWGKPFSGQEWDMDEMELDYGIRFAELHIKSVVGVSEMIADHADARMRRSVIECIAAFGGKCTMGQMLSRMKMKRKPIAETLDALLEEKRVRRVMNGVEWTYELMQTEAVSLGVPASWSEEP